MKRLVIAALVVVAVGAVAGSALAAKSTGSSTIYNSTNPNGPATNLPSYGPAAYSFKTIGDKITFAGTARSLSSVAVTLSSWACENGGSWGDGTCVTEPGATFSQPITLKIYDAKNYDASNLATPIAASTQTFDVPYRPSASAKCVGTTRPGGWYQQSSKECKNGLANDVTFSFSGGKLPDTVVYAISYNTGGPADSLNVAITDKPSAGTSDDANIWIDGTEDPPFGSYTPAVQFKAGNAS
jgi:hypothetical protein